MWSRIKDFVVAFAWLIALVVVVMTLAAGIFAIFNHRDTLLTTISFVLTGISTAFTVLAVIIAMPSTLNWITQYKWRKVIRNILYILIIISLVFAIPLGVLVMQEPVIKIGISLPFRGSNSDKQDAIPILNSIKQAVSDETKNTGVIKGYTIQLVPFDDSYTNNEKIQLMPFDSQNLIGKSENFSSITGDAQISGIIGPFNSGATINELPFTDEALIPLISPANTADCLTNSAFANKDGFPCNTKDLDQGTYFRMATVDSIRAKVLASYFWKEKGYKKAAIYDDETAFGRSSANRFQEAWKKEANEDAPIYDLTGNTQNDLQQLSNNPPDVIIFAGTGVAGIALHHAMESNPTFSHITFAGSSTIMRGKFTNPSDTDDTYVVSPYSNFEQSNENMYNNFRSEYENNYQGEPTLYSASAYDATMILLKSIENTIDLNRPPVAWWAGFQANPFRREIIKNISLVNNNGAEFNFTGITGTYHFNPYGDAIDSNQEQEATMYLYNKQSDSWNSIYSGSASL